MAADDTIIRDVVLAELKPRLPRKWALKDTQRTVDSLATTTAILRQQRIEREPAEPKRSRRAFFELVVAVPLEDTGPAELELDDRIVDVLGTLDSIEGLTWTSCTKGVLTEDYPAPCYLVEFWAPFTIKKAGS